MKLKFWFLICIGSASIPTAQAQDSWTNKVKGNSYKWEDGSKWSLGVPPSGSNTSVFVTNNPTAGSGSGQTINIDATTAGSFPSTMNIGTLTLSITSGANHNTVLISNTGFFHISQDLEVLNRCTLSVTNAGLEVDNYTDVEGTLNIAGDFASVFISSPSNIALDIGAAPASSGTVLLTGGQLGMGNETDIGDNGAGQMSVSNATWLPENVIVGANSGSQGVLTIVNGGNVTSDTVIVGGNLGSQGTLTVADGGILSVSSLFFANNIYVGSIGMGTAWLTGGQIDLGKFSQITLGANFGGVGMMTVSNGTCHGYDLNIGGYGQGTLALAGGLTTVADEFDLGQFATGTGTVWMTGGQLLVGFDTLVGDAGVGQMTVSNGTWQSWLVEVASGFDDHSLGGTLVVAGGTNSVFHELMIGSLGNTTGTVIMTGGSLTITNGAHDAELDLESGALTLSGGILTADVFANTNPCCATFQQTGGILMVGGTTIGGGYADVGFGFPGSLTIANGASVTSDLYVGGSGTGTVWLTGGQIDASTSGLIVLGVFGGGGGNMTVSNGTCQSFDTVVGENGAGMLALVGGVTTVSNELLVGGLATTGTVWLTGGQLVVGFDTVLGDSGVGQMIVSNGAWQSGFVEVGSGNGGRGSLTVAGGANSAYSGLSIGTPNCSGKGTVIVSGGGLFVTNAAHNAVLDLESGTVTLSGGTLAVDVLVTNNSCGVFQQTGGTLIVGGITNLSSPLPFNITGISRSGNDMRITWQTPGGVTNVVQATNGGPSGSYNTNFVDLSPQFILTGSGAITTNYLDVGGATNFPSRFYRVRLVP